MNLGSARQSKIDPTERDHYTPCKASEEGQFCKAAASPNSQNLTEHGIDCIDVYYPHRHNPDVPIEESLGAMLNLIEAGKILYVGLSEATGAILEKAHQVVGDSLVAIEENLEGSKVILSEEDLADIAHAICENPILGERLA